MHAPTISLCPKRTAADSDITSPLWSAVREGWRKKAKDKDQSCIKEGCVPGNITWYFGPHSTNQNLATWMSPTRMAGKPHAYSESIQVKIIK
jgi:hypothetical protein